MDVTLKPIAPVRNNRKEVPYDFWGDIISEIELEMLKDFWTIGDRGNE